MKKGFGKIAVALGLVIILAVALIGCGEKVVSAYDIAVTNGFVGTEQEWLDSLQGKNGLDGQRGENGKDGALTPEDLYNTAVENGFNGSYLEFLKEYLKVDVGYDNTFAVSKAVRSAVVVVSKFTKTVHGSIFNPMTREDTYEEGGAGVIYQMDGNGNAYIITNFHVVYSGESLQPDHISNNISLYLYGNTPSMGKYDDLSETGRIPASFVGGSAYYDIAVLRVSGSEILKNSSATAVTVGKETVTVGQTAMAIGYPAGEGMSITSGIVSVDSESISVSVDGKNAYPLRVMRVDTAINSGNSGGGLFDSDGNLIGIVNAKFSSTQIENIGYAIPKDLAIRVADNIIKNCANDNSKKAVYRCLIGVNTYVKDAKAVYDDDTGKTIIKETVCVAKITEGSKAAEILQEGDIFKKATLNGKTVEIDREYVFREFLLEASAGDTVTIVFERDGIEKTETITFDDGDVTEYFVA